MQLGSEVVDEISCHDHFQATKDMILIGSGGDEVLMFEQNVDSESKTNNTNANTNRSEYF